MRHFENFEIAFLACIKVLTLCILMDFPKYIDAISIGLPILYFNKGSQVDFSKLIYISVSEIVLILANSVDPDEMQHYAAFHLGLHCLQKHPFRGFKNTRG